MKHGIITKSIKQISMNPFWQKCFIKQINNGENRHISHAEVFQVVYLTPPFRTRNVTPYTLSTGHACLNLLMNVFQKAQYGQGRLESKFFMEKPRDTASRQVSKFNINSNKSCLKCAPLGWCDESGS